MANNNPLEYDTSLATKYILLVSNVTVFPLGV
jgi:hypothetical protein